MKNATVPLSAKTAVRTEVRLVPETDLVSFLSDCMKENLNHARHVENEIHSFTGVYMAVVAGLLAFNFSNSDTGMTIALYVILLIAGGIALGLIHRWYGVFDNHSNAAQNAYYTLVDINVNGKNRNPLQRMRELQKCSGRDERKALISGYTKDDDLKTMYLFSHTRKVKWLRTRWFIYGFHLSVLIVVFVLFIHAVYIYLLAG
jgi:hypothetical protein